MSSFAGLLNNAALLLALGVVYDSLGLDAIRRKVVREVLSGLLVGFLGVSVMLTPWQLAPGIFFDTRWILISLSALFFGLVPTLIAVAMTVSFRLFQGGTGAIVGSLVIVVTSGVGYSWRRLEQNRKWKLTWWNLYLFGILVQLAMLACMFLMPAEVRFKILAAVAPPILLIYPIGTMLLGLILRRQRDRRTAEDDREKLQAQLAQAQKIESIGQLAGGVAHDFNNMLGVILGHTELALKKAGPSQPLVDNLKQIRDAAERSADLTRQLLTFARKQNISPKVLDLNQTVAGMLNMLQRLIGENINLSWNPGANLWSVKVDPSQIDQILANLCVNARDAITGNGKITIKTTNSFIDERYSASRPYVLLPGEYVQLSVSDDGCGMDPGVQSHIFEPFFTTKDIGSGTGLGLAMVYGAVKQNSGFITIYSEPGQGTIFNLYFPRVNEEVETIRETTEKQDIRGTETILLVEDDEMLLRLETDILEEAGYQVLVAPTIDLALELGKNHPEHIHLLITDMIMPGMNGRELSEKLSAHRPDMEVLFMSGYTADIISKHGVIEEGVHFLQKPVTFDMLTTKVREVLDAAT